MALQSVCLRNCTVYGEFCNKKRTSQGRAGHATTTVNLYPNVTRTDVAKAAINFVNAREYTVVNCTAEDGYSQFIVFADYVSSCLS